MPKLPGADEPHQIPSGFWKIIITPEGDRSYYFDQDTPAGFDFQNGATSIETIEARTGLKIPRNLRTGKLIKQ